MVSKQDVEYIAVLARLSFSEEEKQAMTQDLNQILNYVEKLNELDTTNVEPLANVSDRNNALRDDVVKPSIATADALRNAPDFQDRFFKVPKVIG
ncbi:MAG: Asp-tRNA(Asn)/Glu-tRNA(Gln) amidotransferase subunit GatC [Chloroherpetonaceae bacterium]|nr:Asp-tRNA(Asn)/Glu-tRNA(Gln) amidotransferase subunit GatC [Chloroherpetonaceae bacterium]MDW8436771.1 Asp-tRNA(Asn)/Glu-tRNA(Gln) amidotransferase subunit GatC [Chloroherpetonaceae bacterium]